MRTAGAVAVAAVLLPSPAFSNGYPLVFPNTGTYLSRAIRNNLGWDRPVSYSPLLPPLHMKLTASVVVAMASPCPSSPQS